jgi:lipid II:glycine glycyltransferase (peptidoglycan interpeptide bridge formation enzyme)
MKMHKIDPLLDERWLAFLHHHPSASVFHTRGWMAALQRTYGFRPLAFTTSEPAEDLADGIAFCVVESWLTGRRLVSMPFSDHCDPLAQNDESLHALIGELAQSVTQERCRYMELRPLFSSAVVKCGLQQTESFYVHRIDLRSPLAEIFRAFHPSCVKRQIKRAERTGVECEKGNSPALLKKFYRLQVLTRSRHGLPPQPFSWFQNLAFCTGENLQIGIASKAGRALAGMISLRFGQKVIYKYSASLKDQSNTGAGQLLLWNLIQDSRHEGATELDLGRCEVSNTTLAQFKERWGAERRTMHYWRNYPESPAHAPPQWKAAAAKRVLSCLPSKCLAVAGNLFYKHAA